MSQQQAIHKFTLGQKEVEGKQAEFWYDRGWYSIVELEGEEKNTIYRSKNAQEAYMKWNVYIGRKKERPIPDDRRRNENSDGGSRRQRQDNRSRNDRGDRGEKSDRRQDSQEGRENRERRRRRDRRDNRRREEREERYE
jgi:hypothetical protein